MPKVDLGHLAPVSRTGYPPPFDQAVLGRWQQKIGAATGLTDFGVNRVRLEPGAWSSQRHWHDGEDEFLVMISGQATLVEDDGRTVLTAGDCASWPKGTGNGHHLINDTDAECVFIVIGGGVNTGGGYSDIDMLFTAEGRYTHKDGTPYGPATGGS